MASFKCKKCKAKNTIPKEWIELGISRIVNCNTCNYKMNVNLGKSTTQQPQGTAIIDNLQTHNHTIDTPSGTQVDGLSSSATTNNYSLEITEGKKHAIAIDLEAIKETHNIYLGRNPSSKRSINDNDAVWIIDDPYVSRLHCQITVVKQTGQAKFILQDGGSANGTEVNQNKLESGDQVLLNIGDQIVIGDTKVVLKKN